MACSPSTHLPMKKILALLLFVALASTSFALNKNVTPTGTAATLVTPSQYIRTLVIQNTGSGDVRIGIDGGTTQGVADPTAAVGQLVKAGTFVIFTYPGNYKPPVIRVILTSGTSTTVAVSTDDTIST